MELINSLKKEKGIYRNNKNMAKKRERLEVIKDILKSIRENRNIKPTRLLYASNLSPQMFKEYINELISKEFIKLDIDDKEKKTFSLAQRGNEFLEEYRVIENFVENFGL
jgi:predicted transcriptional regulator